MIGHGNRRGKAQTSGAVTAGVHMHGLMHVHPSTAAIGRAKIQVALGAALVPRVPLCTGYFPTRERLVRRLHAARR